MFTSTLRIAALAVIALGGTAQAQTLADELNRRQAQIQLLESQEQLNKALQRAADPILSKMPQILAISGMEGDLGARLILANGTVGTYKEGDTVRGSMKVVGITHKAVMVSMASPRSKKPTVMALEFVPGGQSRGAGPTGSPGGTASMGAVGAPLPIPVELLPAPPRVNLGTPVPQVSAVAPTASVAPAAAQPAQAR